MVSNIDDEDDIDIDDIEQLEPQQYTGKQILSLTFETFCRKSIFYPLLFTFLIAAMSRSNQVIDYYLMYNLKFNSYKIGYLQIISSIAFIISVIIITIHSKSTRFSLRFLFGIWTFISAIIPYSSLILNFGIINKSFFQISDFIYSILNRLIIRITVDMLLLATAVLYARICPPGIEGYCLQLLTSIATVAIHADDVTFIEINTRTSVFIKK